MNQLATKHLSPRTFLAIDAVRDTIRAMRAKNEKRLTEDGKPLRDHIQDEVYRISATTGVQQDRVHADIHDLAAAISGTLWDRSDGGLADILEEHVGELRFLMEEPDLIHPDLAREIIALFEAITAASKEGAKKLFDVFPNDWYL